MIFGAETPLKLQFPTFFYLAIGKEVWVIWIISTGLGIGVAGSQDLGEAPLIVR